MDKSEFKAAVVNELGVKVEDMAEAAKLDVARNEGAKEALLIASKKILDLAVHVDKDLDEGLLSEVGEPLIIAQLIKKYLSRASSVLESGSVSAENHRLIATGRLQGLQLVVGNMGKIRDAELQKSKQRQSIESGAEMIGRTVGAHPGLTIKEQRNLETTPIKPVTKAKKRGRPKKVIDAPNP